MAEDPGDHGRDRVADLLRVVAIVLVVLGHWTVAVVRVRDGTLVVERLLVVEPWTQWMTWVFQVMPVFFLVGGFVNAGSWRRARDRGDAWSTWFQRRAVRLLRPLAPLVIVWLVATMAIAAVAADAALARTASKAAFAPLWFLGTYVFAVAMVPATHALHRRAGSLVVVGFVVAAVLVDALARRDVPFVAFANLVLVWVGIHQMGYFWEHPRLRAGSWHGLAIAAGAVAILAGLVAWGIYPRSMASVGGDLPNNAAPPTAALFLLALAQIGLIVAFRRFVTSWMRRPAASNVVAVVGSAALTVFLWHVTALLVAAVVLHGTGFWRPAALGGTWWATRPIFILACAVILVPLVLAFRRFETRLGTAPSRRAPIVLVALATVLAGIAWINLQGFDPESLWPAAVVTSFLLGGLWGIGVLGPRRATETGGSSL